MKKQVYFIIVSFLILTVIALVVLNDLGDRILEEGIRETLVKKETSVTKEGEPSNTLPASTRTDEKDKIVPSIDLKTITTSPSPGTQQTTTSLPEDVQQKNGQSSEASSSVPESSQKSVAAHEKPINHQPTASEPVDKSAADKQVTDKKEIIPDKEIEEIKSKVTLSDRLTAAAMAVKRLSPSDILELEKMLSDGISDEDKEKAKQMVYSKFTPEEIQQIRELYHKYLK